MIAILAVFLVAALGCGNAIQKLRARDNLNKGVNAFKSANYPQAIERFKQAIELDPDFLTARLYLATAYMSQYVPGAESEENLRNAEAATKGFMEVLERAPNNALAVESLGSLFFNQKKLDEAKKWYLKLIEIDKEKKEAFYTVGVIDWTKVYQPRMEVRAQIGMKPEDPGPIKDKKAREQLKEMNEPVIKEGIEMLEKAVAIDPNYDDAMAYLNLMYRERADIADTSEENRNDIAQADQWVQKALDTKKRKAEGPASAQKTS
ncbi:MAG: tetratricopeptide repeat protein [Acidobacteria bacterium]|nr:tetratricopeptide repeat protein [Acidobacteriota bacterium]